MHKAVIPVKHNFYHLRELFQVLDNNLDIPNVVLNKARYFRDELFSSEVEEVLLHGDLHHENILKMVITG